MNKLSNAEILNYVLDCMLRVVGKKKSNLFAITTLAEIIKNLEQKHPFLRYITIDTKVFSETWIAVSVDQEIDTIEEKQIGRAVNDIINKLSKCIKSDEGYYIIREIRDELKYEMETNLQRFGVDLNIKQFEYGIFKDEEKRIEISGVKNSEIVKSILQIVIKLLRNVYQKSESISTLNTYIKNLELTYDFLKYITIKYVPGSDEFYLISISSEIDDIPPTQLGESIGKIVYEISSSIAWKGNRSFIENFKNLLKTDEFQKLNEIGVKLDRISIQLKRQKHQKISQRILETLFALLLERTSKESAQQALDTTIKKLQKDYDVLHYITLDPDAEIHIFTVSPEINTVESYKVGKAFREMIKILHDIYGDKTFVSDFKTKLGDEYLCEIEEMGINLHFLEIRFV